LKVLLPISYLGPASYFSVFIQSSEVFIESNEHFVKQSIRNRCSILSSNGTQLLSIPKERKSADKTLITDINISKSQNWQKLHWQALISSYNSSPFFEYYKDQLGEFYHTNPLNLFNFNLRLTELILSFLQTEKKIHFTSEYNRKFDGIDFRNHKFKNLEMDRYEQVFSEKIEFQSDLSVLDVLFNLGPETTSYLERQSI
tara:strand:+ start:2308 stop:2907 length:600 start_codon:yes stop_codon:yes gene_type:complete